MKISLQYNLNKTQAELDFIDIDPDIDLPLFLDPFFLSQRQDKWSFEAARTVRSFFQEFINLVREDRENEAKNLFNHLSEPNSTCLGVSSNSPKGRGLGNRDATRIYANLLNSRAIQTGLVQDIEDNILFVEKFGKDKLSDMTTNIITRHLIQYTKNQCDLHNITLTPGIPSGYFWNSADCEWQTEHAEMLVINDKKILLVPKGIVSFSRMYTPEKYYNSFVLTFLQNEQLTLGGLLVQKRKNGTRYVTKKSLKAENPFSKEFLRTFTETNSNVLERFKNTLKITPLNNQQIESINIDQIKQSLILNLQNTNPGGENATNYHKIVTGILEVIFYPILINPIKEREIHEGRKRIDISFDNASTTGIFYRLSASFNIPCPYIFIECKNYSNDISNPELDQISGRFSVNRGKVGFIVCRTVDNMHLFISRCRDTFKDGRGLIIPLVDEDLVSLLENHSEADNTFMEQFLSNRIREITIN